MGGMFQHKEFFSLKSLLIFLQEQIENGEALGLYLQLCYFEEVKDRPGTYKLTAYYSK